ncbi:hypothetical protein HDU86_000094 [Geranomyces michiganensis]|nr:hypothetical protein HDU86_000094 [Geranomyces michiganensis]
MLKFFEDVASDDGEQDFSPLSVKERNQVRELWRHCVRYDEKQRKERIIGTTVTFDQLVDLAEQSGRVCAETGLRGVFADWDAAMLSADRIVSRVDDFFAAHSMGNIRFTHAWVNLFLGLARAAEKLVNYVVSPDDANKRNRPGDHADDIRKRLRIMNADPNAKFIDSVHGRHQLNLGIPGELMSAADQREKHIRTKDEKRFGKKEEFMYHVMALKKRAPDCRDVVVPFFQILDLKGRFLLQFEVAHDIYVMHQYQEVSFLQDDVDALGMLELVEAFLTVRDIIESTTLATTKTRTKRSARRLTTPPPPQLLAGVTTPPIKAASEKKSSTGRKAKGRKMLAAHPLARKPFRPS